MSLAEEVLHIIEEAAATQEFSRVKTVILEIGQLAAVESEAMRFCFEAVAANSIAEGAALEIVELSGAGWCKDCSSSVPLSEQPCVCPRCGGFRVEVTAGTAMRVRELRVE